MPTSVYRPAIVVGDSRTGDTQKFDGPYFLLQWLLRQPRAAGALVPLVGDPTMVRFNMVPSDFVIDAIDHLSGLEASAGRTYQLADPRPLTVDELLDRDVPGHRPPGRAGAAPPPASRPGALAHVGAARARYVGIPAERGRVLRPPHPLRHGRRPNATSPEAASPARRCADYLPTLVRFMVEHRDANVGVMV